MKTINTGLFGESDTNQYTESELEKAFPSSKFAVLTEEEVCKFSADLDAIIKKGEASALTSEEVDAVEKGKKDITKLTRNTVIGKDGKKRTVYVKMKDADHKKVESGKEDGGNKGKASNKVIGTTSSGKPVYDKGSHNHLMTKKDYEEASNAHKGKYKEHRVAKKEANRESQSGSDDNKKKWNDAYSFHEKKEKHHRQQSEFLQGEADTFHESK